MAYTNYKDVHTLTNSGISDMTYTLSRTNCDTTTQVASGVILPSKSVELGLKTDGDYTLSYTQGVQTTTVEIKSYFNLVTSFITNAESILCGCKPCSTCEECNTCEEYLEGFIKATAINSMLAPLYEPYTKLIAEESKCDFTDVVLCNLLKEKVYGNFEIKDALIRILSYYYTAFYYKDHILAVDTEEKAYVTTKYKFDKISKCLRKLGIDPKEAIENFEKNTLVYYWQLSNVGDNINQVIPLITPTYLSSKPFHTYEEFEQGQIVAYNEIGRAVFVISSTQVVEFAITDALNNDITDEFDKDSSIPNTVIYVSKNPYSYSSIYFNFKKTL